MGNRFRKKPTTVEAVQWFQMGDHPSVVKMLDTAEGEEVHSPAMEEAWGKHASVFHALRGVGGNRRVNPGDWIISDSNGEQYPCDAEAFALAYEPENAGATQGDKDIFALAAITGTRHDAGAKIQSMLPLYSFSNGELEQFAAALAAHKSAGERVSVVRIPAQNALDPITIYFEDYSPGSGRMTVACFGDAWTAAWSAMGDRGVREFVASVDAGYLSGAFLQLCGGNGRHRIYTDRIARAIIDHLAPDQPEDRKDG